MRHARALVIEPNATARSTMATQLRDTGISDVRSRSSPSDARLILECEQFDVVLCCRDFDVPDTIGLDLVDELRRERLLPHATVFIMVVSQATYAQVTEAGEASLDGVLLRPYTADSLSERIVEARRRKAELADLLAALAEGDDALAAELCLARWQHRQADANYAARVATELMLRIGDMQALQKRREDVRSRSNAPWARLALVRAQLQRGDWSRARKAFEELVASEPAYADALDTLGRIHLEVGDVGRAFAAFRGAVELTPGCLLRAQACGTLAFYAVDKKLARLLLNRCVSLGIQLRLFDPLTLLILTVLRFDERSPKGLAAAHEQMRSFAERVGNTERLATFDRAVPSGSRRSRCGASGCQ
jgi:CheY-like chemotaxis protein